MQNIGRFLFIAVIIIGLVIWATFTNRERKDGNKSKSKKGFEKDIIPTIISLIENSLHVHTYNGHPSYENMVELLKKRRDIEVKTSSGGTPLMIASLVGDTNIVNLLLENGADISVRTPRGNTILEITSGEGHIDVVKLLLEYGADPNDNGIYVPDSDTSIALMIATTRGHAKVANLLLRHGAIKMYHMR